MGKQDQVCSQLLVQKCGERSLNNCLLIQKCEYIFWYLATDCYYFYICLCTVKCKVLLNRPHSKLGEHCTVRCSILTKRIIRRCACHIWATIENHHKRTCTQNLMFSSQMLLPFKYLKKWLVFRCPFKSEHMTIWTGTSLELELELWM